MKAIATTIVMLLLAASTATGQEVTSGDVKAYQEAAAEEARLSASIFERLEDLAKAESKGYDKQAADIREQLRVLRIRRDQEAWQIELLVGLHGDAIRGAGAKTKIPPTADIESNWRARQAAVARVALVNRLRAIEHTWTHTTH
ncbi:MAG: hypothetical protein QGI75_07515 [Phycisphaerales bacterium]|jgi:hypothetical protein|nr:hypothetical protein [Phycisphaerales bacterium]